MKLKTEIIDGCTASTYIAYALSDVATIYPISPASDMSELADKWASQGRKNLMGQTMVVRELQSEAGAAGAVHGSLSGGALTTTFTASQGLLLMIPNMYKIAGELLPAVFHVTARSLSTHALSIFGDHQDVMACRQTGFAFLASSSVQECMDLALVSHLSAIEGSVPFCHFFDGWRTSSEMQTTKLIDYEDIRGLVNWDKVRDFRRRAMNPEHPDVRGTAQNPDIYFQNREAGNRFYNALPDIVEKNMRAVEKITGRSYHPFDYVGHELAEQVIVAIGSSCNVIEETVRHLLKKGEKVGLIKVRLYRPFSKERFLEAIPKSAKIICALDRTKEAGAQGEPLFLDVCAALHSAGSSLPVIGGRYGLSSKDFTPCMANAIFGNMKSPSPKATFTVGITDDVTSLSLSVEENLETTQPGIIQCKFFGFGSDGTVGANRQAADIVGKNTDLYVQAYFSYDSKKSGGYTVSHLRFGKEQIQSSYPIIHADYIACHKDSYVRKFDVLDGIKENGTFVLNSTWSTTDDLERELSAQMLRTIAQKRLKLFNVDAVKIAGKVGLGGRINMIMETVFFKLSNVMDFEKAVSSLKENVKKIYAMKGDAVVQMSLKAIDNTIGKLTEIKYPDSWKEAEEREEEGRNVPDFVRQIAEPILALKGDGIPVSELSPDGIVPVGTTQYEKRAVAINIPIWDNGKCIQCCQCSMVCPHASIRAYWAKEEETKDAPISFTTKEAVGGDTLKNMRFRIQVFPEDCQGCGSCANVCPVDALSMQPLKENCGKEKLNLDYAQKHIRQKEGYLPRNTVKGSQMYQPLFEFSGACAGCGETPYVKLITQLFGERMIIANATGCSSIYGASMPSMPYTTNGEHHGPAWGNSLFEDAGEYGYGIHIAIKHRRNRLKAMVGNLLNQDAVSEEIKSALAEWEKAENEGNPSSDAGKKISELLKEEDAEGPLKELSELADLLVKKSVWIVGGDGWAYDIGFGGLDHVLASGENINVLVLDTECYSNTGGQTSKATPLGAVAKFASSGKRTNKKELGRMMMTYGNVYVASIAMGANKQQTIDAISEAEAFDGPSVVIAYSPCQSWHTKRHGHQHGRRAPCGGMWLLATLPIQPKTGRSREKPVDRGL